MRTKSVLPSCLLAIGLLSALALPASGAEARYRARAVPVTQPGLVRLELDAKALAGAWARGDWTILDPDGSPVSHAVLESAKGVLAPRSISVAEVPSDQGRWITFDLGLVPVRHHRLRVEPKQDVTARGAVLNASPDGSTWRSIGGGDLFRLGSQESLKQCVLEYAPVTDRYLRLLWPAEAGFPQFASVVVETAPEPAGSPKAIDFAIAPFSAPPAQAAYLLTAPADDIPMGELRIDMAASAPCAVVVSILGEDRARPLVHALPAPFDGSFSIDASTLAPTRRRRVILCRIHGSAESPPKLSRVSALVPARWILFEAARAGTYTLAYEHHGFSNRPANLAVDRLTDKATDLRVESEEIVPKAPLPPRALETRKARAESWSTNVYELRCPEVPPGAVVRVELPEAISADLRARRATLKVRSGDRDLSYLRWTPPESALLLDTGALAPQASGTEPGTSLVSLELPERRSIIHSIEVFAPGRHAPRRVHVRAESRPRLGVEESSLLLAAFDWDLWPEGIPPYVPTSVAFGVNHDLEERDTLLVSFDDEDRDPLPEVRILLWRKRDILVFARPDASAVDLVLERGTPILGRPIILESEAEELLALPFVEAAVDLETKESGERETESRNRMLLTIAMGVVALVLIFVLARSIRPTRPSSLPPATDSAPSG